MGVVLSFKQKVADRRRYEEALEKAICLLGRSLVEVQECCIRLAMLKSWKEWDERTPVGTLTPIGDDDLAQAPDKNVVALVQVTRAMMDTIEWITPIEESEEESPCRRKGKVIGWICGDKKRREAMSDPCVAEIIKTFGGDVVGVRGH